MPRFIVKQLRGLGIELNTDTAAGAFNDARKKCDGPRACRPVAGVGQG